MFERKDGRYQVSYRDENGVQRVKTFRAGPEGKEAADKFEKEVAYKKTFGIELTANAEEPGELFIDELAKQWYEQRNDGQHSLRWVREFIHVFNTKILKDLPFKPCCELNRDELLRPINIHWRNSSPATRNRYVGYLKSMLQIAVDDGRLKENPLARYKFQREPRRVSDLTLQGLRMVQRECPEHLAWAIEVMWNVPVRPGVDLFGLRYDTHVFYEGKYLRVYHTKVRRWVKVPVTDGFLNKVRAQEKTTQSGFIIEYDGQPLKRVDKALKRAVLRAQKKHGASMVKMNMLYDVRHLWITTMMDKGRELSTIAYLAGTSPEMILKNYYEQRGDLRGAVQDMPMLNEEQSDNRVIDFVPRRPSDRASQRQGATGG